MKKRIFTSFILICLLLTMPACAAGADQPAEDNAERLSVQSTGFTDVPADAWYAQAVEYCRENGLMAGTSDITFAPEGTLTRAMLAAILYRMSGTPAVSARLPFPMLKLAHGTVMQWPGRRKPA